MLESSERELAEIQAARDSSVSTSLLTRLDSPMVSDRPIGPGKATISGLRAIAGLVLGLGIMFIVTPIDATPVFGRRTHDRQRGRRDADLALPPESAADNLAPSAVGSMDSLPTLDIDKAFRELALLKSHKPESRSEELSLQMKVQELSAFLSSRGVQIGREAMIKEESPRTIPRQTRPT